jgi:hypothetical protein
MSGAEQTGEEMPTSFSSPTANWRAHQRAGSICAGCHSPANNQQAGPVVGGFFLCFGGGWCAASFEG